jgi:type I restriction enzyme, S subunit
MNGHDLKNSILQLAIQGKLAEQREEEGTAKELLEQIKVEKEKLIVEKKIKKEKSLLEITVEEIPFDIPKSWEWVRLGNVLEIARGGSPRPIKAYLTNSEDGINWIKIGDTDKGGKYINSTNEKIKKEGMKKSRYVRKGDFLLSNSMSFGRPYILNIDGCIHDGWLVLSQEREIFDRDFLYYLLSSSMVFNQFSSRVSGAVVNNLNSDKVKITLVPLPPLEEQKRIVAKIEGLMSYVEKYDKAHSEVVKLNKRFPEDMQKSILQYAIQGKLVEQREEEGTVEELYQQIQEEKENLVKDGKIKKQKPLNEITEDEIPFEIPKSWKWVRLGDLFNVSTGMTPSKSNPLFHENGDIPWITSSQTGDLKIKKANNFITKYAIENTSLKIYPKHTLLIAMYGQGKTRGQISELLLDATINQACAALENIIDDDNFRSYIQYFQMYNYDISRTGSEGSAQPNLNLDKIRNILVPLPPLEEQKRIVAKIEELLFYIKTIR